MRSHYKILKSVEYALGTIAVLSLFVFVIIHMCAELEDPDIWLHLKTGECIIKNKAIPQVDIFSFSVSGRSWVNHSWLVQAIFYLAFSFGRANTLILLSAILVAFSFLLLFLSVPRRPTLIFSAAMLALTIFASTPRFNIRPENFSILFFSTYLFILSRHIRTKGIYFLVPLQLIWANCHGFFILGPILIGVFPLAQKLKKAAWLPQGWSKVEPLDARSCRNLTRVFLFACLACFLNPYGYKGAFYPIGVILGSLGKEGIYYNYIQELLPVFKVQHSAMLAYYLLITISLFFLLLNYKRINIAHLIIWLLFLSISFRANRNIIFFNFFAYFATLYALKDKFEKEAKEKPSKILFLLKYAIAVLITAFCLADAGSLLRQHYYIFEENRFKGKLFGVKSIAFPDQAIDFILKNGLPENIFNLFNHGSYFIYRAYPLKRNFIDGRSELYGEDFFKDYLKIAHLDQNTINRVFEKYGINTVFLSGAGLESFDNLSRYFFQEETWTLVYFDGFSAVFIKKTPNNQALINKLKIDLSCWQTKKSGLKGMRLKKIFPYPYTERARMFYYWGLHEQAISEAREALRIFPGSAEAYNIIGSVYAKEGLFALAEEYLNQAKIFGPNKENTLKSLGGYYTLKNDFKAAVLTYKKLIEINPDSAQGYALLAEGLVKINQVKTAVLAFKRALELNPFEAGYYKELAELLQKNGDLKGAREIYKKALNSGLDLQGFSEGLNRLNKGIVVK